MTTIHTPRQAVDDEQWQRIAAEFNRPRWQRRVRMAVHRVIRQGETSQVFIAAVWAMVVLAYPDALASTYLAVYMPGEAWAVLFSAVAAVHLALLVHGCIMPRAVMAALQGTLWSFASFVVLHHTPHGSALGPTLTVFAAGCFVACFKLARMRKDWPL